MNKFVLKINPELGDVLPPGFEVTQDLLNGCHAFGGWQLCTLRPMMALLRAKTRSGPSVKKATRSSASTKVRSSGSAPKIPANCSRLTLPVGNIRAPVSGTLME